MIKMNKKTYIQAEQKRITGLVARKYPEYYLTGGTALAFYFQHRFSDDLDFFSQSYVKTDPARIMRYIKKETGFSYQLDSVQDDPKLVSMAVYFMELKNKQVLKIDFVRDFAENIKEVIAGLHSVDDIYVRKLRAAVGSQPGKSDSGRGLATGRQSVKDLFDLYWLSTRHKELSGFCFEYFAYDEISRLDAWYRGFDRTELKWSLSDLAPGADVGIILKHLDEQIYKKIPGKMG